MQQSLVHNLLAQKRALLQKMPELESFFVDIDGAPFLPIGCFRNFHVFAHDTAHTTFLSSGSTNDSRARHSFSEAGLAHYQSATAENFRAFLTEMGMSSDATIVSLVPTPAEWPQSSLAAMIDMFKREGLGVVYFDQAKDLELPDDVVVFGTSIHHILMQQQPMFAGKNLLVIDTGGTKGRTRNYTLSEVHDVIRKTYGNAASCKIASEYGMCELNSQAYSLHAPHDGWFKANVGLEPAVVDLDKRSVVRHGQVGFLAFIDAGNQDSFMGIITEDLAMMQDDLPGCFKLVGRAPDASQKGCSLNVKANFVETSFSVMPATCPPKPKRRGKALNPATWDEYSKRDLEITMESLRPLDVKQRRAGQRVLMVLSANIPITFLYPTFTCFYKGAAEVHLQLPSNRVNDPTSERVRAQIESLVERVAPMVSPMKVVLRASRDISFSALKDFDAVVVFGSDETLRTFAEHMPAATELIGLGAIQNAMRVDETSAEELADLCGRWLGRGCLTPIALVGAASVEEFVREFEKNFSARVKAANAENPFAHRHRLFELQSRYPAARIYRGANTFVVDLRSVKSDAASYAGGGSGLVYVISESQFEGSGLNMYDPEPGFNDLHQGKTWSDWI